MEFKTESFNGQFDVLPVQANHSRHGVFPGILYTWSALIAAWLLFIYLFIGTEVPILLMAAPGVVSLVFWIYSYFTNPTWRRKTISDTAANSLVELVGVARQAGVAIPPAPAGFPSITNEALLVWCEEVSTVLRSNYRSHLAKLVQPDPA